MSRTFTFTTSVERYDDEIDVQVTYTCTPFIPATYWQPAEGGEVEIVEAVFVGVDAASMSSPLTDAEFDKLTEEASDRAWQDWHDDLAERADCQADQARDRAMIERWDREQGDRT